MRRTERASAAAARLPRTSLPARALLAGVLGAAAAAAPCAATAPSTAARWVVVNCDDDGPGSLRTAVRDLAASGDTIDLSQLACSTITLTTGAIATGLDDLTLVGSEAGIGISGDDRFPVAVHLGSGTMSFRHVSIVHGYKYNGTDAARGGCIYSLGSVALNDVTLAYCVAHGPTAAAGGGVFAAGNLVMIDSIITGAAARTDGGGAQGGGAMVGGVLAAKYSALTNNVASAQAGPGFSSCGAAAAGGASVIGSSIVGNVADYFGGLCANDANAATPLVVRNSTVSDNASLGASPSTGGTGINAQGALVLANSTVSHNTQAASGDSVGVYVRTSAAIDSSIIANNVAGSGAAVHGADLGGGPSATVAGSHNLIQVSTLALPPDTLNADPQLGQIGVHLGGRPTAYVRTPANGSPVVDAGSNPFDLEFDQRGAPYLRISAAAVDIGAVELQRERIFADGFDDGLL